MNTRTKTEGQGETIMTSNMDQKKGGQEIGETLEWNMINLCMKIIQREKVVALLERGVVVMREADLQSNNTWNNLPIHR